MGRAFQLAKWGEGEGVNIQWNREYERNRGDKHPLLTMPFLKAILPKQETPQRSVKIKI